MWGTEKGYNEEAEWLKLEEERCEGLEQQEWDEIKVTSNFSSSSFK